MTQEMSHMNTTPSHAVWKNIAMFLSGIVLTLIAMWASYVRTAVTRDEMERYVNRSQSGVEARLDELNKNVMELKELTSRMDERTGVRDPNWKPRSSH